VQQQVIGHAAVSTVVVKSLLRDQALIEIEAVAGSDAAGEVEYPTSVFAPDSSTAWSPASEMLHERGAAEGSVLRAAQLIATGAEQGANGAIGARSMLTIGCPRLCDDGAGSQIDLAIARKLKVPLLFVSAQGDADAGDIVGQTRNAYGRIRERLAEAGV